MKGESRAVAGERNPRLSFFRAAVRPDAGKLAMVGVLLAASVLLSFAFPFLMRFLIDVALPLRQGGLIVRITLVVASLYAIQIGASYGANYLYTVSAQNFTIRLRGWMYERMLRLNYVQIGTAGAGDLIARILADVDRVQQFYMSVAFSAVLTIVIALGLLIDLSPELSLLAIILVPVQWLLYQAVANPTQELSPGSTARVPKCPVTSPKPYAASSTSSAWPEKRGVKPGSGRASRTCGTCVCVCTCSSRVSLMPVPCCHLWPHSPCCVWAV